MEITNRTILSFLELENKLLVDILEAI